MHIIQSETLGKTLGEREKSRQKSHRESRLDSWLFALAKSLAKTLELDYKHDFWQDSLRDTFFCRSILSFKNLVKVFKERFALQIWGSAKKGEDKSSGRAHSTLSVNYCLIIPCSLLICTMERSRYEPFDSPFVCYAVPSGPLYWLLNSNWAWYITEDTFRGSTTDQGPHSNW